MAYVGSGTLTTATSSDSTEVAGYATLSGHLDSGTGTFTWEFKGPDGVWRNIFLQGWVADGSAITSVVAAFTGSHVINVFFADDVLVRVTASSVSTPQFDWQVMSSPTKR